MTFVPFLPDGRCVLIERPGGPALPAGEVLAREDYLTGMVLRVPLQTAGFRYQRLRPAPSTDRVDQRVPPAANPVMDTLP